MQNSNSVSFQIQSHLDANQLEIPEGSILFHGEFTEDTRSEKSSSFSIEKITQRIKVKYDFEEVYLSLNDKSCDVEESHELFQEFINGGYVVLDSTTMGFVELFFCIKALVKYDVKNYSILYVEPENYTKDKEVFDIFALTEVNAGYKPIPTSVVDMDEPDVSVGLFFLGYENDRIEKALEEYQMISGKKCILVFGVPAYKPGWELNSIVPHLNVIQNLKNAEIEYCSANDPESAYELIEKTSELLSGSQKMFIAPIGTKPCGIAAALYASHNSEKVGLLYDHRKKKQKRSDGTNNWHLYTITLN